MLRVLGGILGAVAGFGFSTMGLIETRFWSFGGGNENTTEVIVAGVVIGTLVGALVLWRWPLAILGLIIGLAAGMWLRDNATRGTVQPPWVFFLLFGLPLLAAAAGFVLHERTGNRGSSKQEV